MKCIGCDREASYKAAQTCRVCYERARRRKLSKANGPSLMELVEAALVEHGEQDAQQVARHVPGYTVAKIGHALGNLACRDRAHCVRKIRKGNRWGPGVFAAGPAPQKIEAERPMVPRGAYGLPRVSSVFDLGASL